MVEKLVGAIVGAVREINDDSAGTEDRSIIVRLAVDDENDERAKKVRGRARAAKRWNMVVAVAGGGFR
jgi:hypothetical protein